MSAKFTVCVYCGSRDGVDPQFAEAARQVGRWIGENGGDLVYGGGRMGLMGVVADAALQTGAHVTGIIPSAMVQREWGHQGCSELVVVDTMHERKRLMAEKADVFLALAGGIGTLEEFFEAWTWRQLGYHDKPIGLLNTSGYYDGLLDFLGRTVAQDFMGNWQMDLIRSGDSVDGLLTDLLRATQMAAAPQLTGL